MLEFDTTLTQVVEKFCGNVNHFNICENESSSSQYFIHLLLTDPMKIPKLSSRSNVANLSVLCSSKQSNYERHTYKDRVEKYMLFFYYTNNFLKQPGNRIISSCENK